MFPWTASFTKQAALSEAKALRPRAVEAAAEEMAALRKLSEAETTFDDVLLSTEDRLSRGHITRSLDEASSPEGMIKLRRVWREVDAAMGPGKSVVQVLLARYPSLCGVVDNVTCLLRRGLRTKKGGSVSKLVLGQIDEELRAFSGIKDQILGSVEPNVDTIKKWLLAEIEDQPFQRLVTLSSGEVRTECAAALDELERSLTDMRKAVAAGADARPGTAALKEAVKEKLTALKAVKGVGKREVLSSRISRLAEEFGDPMELGPKFARRVKEKFARRLPALEDIEDTSLLYMEALGAIGQAKPDGAKLLRRYVENRGPALNTKELDRIKGYLGQLKGLLPEEIATRMKFMDGIFYKNAFEALNEFPPSLRNKMKVEMVEGPLWVVGAKGPPRQFGDGCLLLTGPGEQSAIVGLGEFKAGFDQDLLNQLFVRSDGRAVSARIQFTGADKQIRTRTLTREFAFGGEEKVALKRPPVYVYGRPAGETPETVAKFKEMVEEQMQAGREMWKIQLPFSAKSNDAFAAEALKEAVKVLKQAKPKWGT